MRFHLSHFDVAFCQASSSISRHSARGRTVLVRPGPCYRPLSGPPDEMDSRKRTEKRGNERGSERRSEETNSGNEYDQYAAAKKGQTNLAIVMAKRTDKSQMEMTEMIKADGRLTEE